MLSTLSVTILFYFCSNKNKYVSPCPRPFLSPPLLSSYFPYTLFCLSKMSYYLNLYILDNYLRLDGGLDGRLAGRFDGGLDGN